MDVLMPQLGETVAEGRITQWYKAPGDAVNPGDNLFEIETDKTSMEVPATVAGVLAEIRAGVGEVVPVGAVVAVVTDGRSVAAASAMSPAPVPSTAPRRPAPGPATAAAASTPALSPAPAANGAAAPIRLDPFFEVRTPGREAPAPRRPTLELVTA